MRGVFFGVGGIRFFSKNEYLENALALEKEFNALALEKEFNALALEKESNALE